MGLEYIPTCWEDTCMGVRVHTNMLGSHIAGVRSHSNMFGYHSNALGTRTYQPAGMPYE